MQKPLRRYKNLLRAQIGTLWNLALIAFSKRLRLGCWVNSETLSLRDAGSRLVRVVYHVGWGSQEESEDLKNVQVRLWEES